MERGKLEREREEGEEFTLHCSTISSANELQNVAYHHVHCPENIIICKLYVFSLKSYLAYKLQHFSEQWFNLQKEGALPKNVLKFSAHCSCGEAQSKTISLSMKICS